MRKSAKWMGLWDDRILEWIREHDGMGSASQMKKSDLILVSRPTISRRLNKMADHNLLKEVGNGMYVITEEGEAYLDEEYNVEAGSYVNRDVANGESGAESESQTENGV
ncbi:MarR family transcriptional regulator [Natronomonas gomsonensis]|nr:MarR family transcriptional regulator [Natronomonas gomsonensis]